MRYDISYSFASIIELCFEAPYVPLRGDSIFRNISFYFLILFMFLFFVRFVLQRSRIHHICSKIVQEIKRKKHPLLRALGALGAHPSPAPRQPACHTPSSASRWVSRLPPCGFSLKHKKPRSQAQETTLIKWSQTNEAALA